MALRNGLKWFIRRVYCTFAPRSVRRLTASAPYGNPQDEEDELTTAVFCFTISSSTSMYLDSAKKAELFEKYGKSATDTGSPESQIALFTFRIAHLTGHLQQNKKDYSTQRALKMIIGKRRRMLDYLQKIDIERYRAIIKELGIRR